MGFSTQCYLAIIPNVCCLNWPFLFDLIFVLIFIVSGENTVKCLEGFS